MVLAYETEKVQSWGTNFAMCVTADATPWCVKAHLLAWRTEGFFLPYLCRGFVMSSCLIATLDPESGRLFALA